MSRPIDSFVHRLWTPWRLRWYPIAFVATLAVAFVVVIASADGPDAISGRVGGDFPAFFGAGSIVADGDIEQLYDLERQVAAQADLFPSGTDALYFAYPPHVAAGYGLLVPLGYTSAYVLQTLLSVAALAAAVVLAEPLLPVLCRRKMLAFAAALAFFPMAEGTLLGQNVAISLFLVVASWRLVVAEQQWAGGAVLGLLVYKPQLAIPLAGLYLLSGRWRVTAGSAVTSGLAFVASASLMGADWGSQWLRQAQDFAELDIDTNGHLATSVVGFLTNAGAEPLGWVVALAIAGAMAWVWWRRAQDLAVPLAVAACGLVLMAPHAQNYEAGLMLVAIAILLDRDVKGLWWLWLVGLGRLAAATIGFNFTIVAVGVGFFLALRLARQAVPVTS
jgi:hypothetical protein